MTARTDELTAALAALENLTGSAMLRRPAAPLAEPGDGRRDPAAEWDQWYETVPRRERAELLGFMAPARRPGDARRPGLSLDELAGELFCTVDNAFATWRAACQDVRTARRHARTAARTTAELLGDPDSALYASEWEQFDAEQLRRAELAIYGPQELARDLGITAGVVHQWRRRGKLPDPDLTISGVPLWHADTLKGAEIL